MTVKEMQDILSKYNPNTDVAIQIQDYPVIDIEIDKVYVDAFDNEEEALRNDWPLENTVFIVAKQNDWKHISERIANSERVERQMS
jgi:hypothetical protein